MNQVRLGMEIRKWRKLRKMTQKQLADGICNQSEISRLEKGDSYPSIETLHAISLKLRLPLSYFFEVLIHDDVENKERITETVKTFSMKKDYEGLHAYLELLFKEMPVLHPELKTYLDSHYYVSLYYLKKNDYRYCVTELYRLVNNQSAGLDILLSVRIKNSIAIILAENERFTESMEIFQNILEENNTSEEYELMKIKVLYNIGKLRYSQGNYNEAIERTEEAIELSIKHRDMSILGQLHYQQAQILEELERSTEEIRANYLKARFFFDLLGLDYYKKILETKKGEYLNTVQA